MELIKHQKQLPKKSRRFSFFNVPKVRKMPNKKKYYEPHLGLGNPVFLLGLGFLGKILHRRMEQIH